MDPKNKWMIDIFEALTRTHWFFILWTGLVIGTVYFLYRIYSKTQVRNFKEDTHSFKRNTLSVKQPLKLEGNEKKDLVEKK